MASYLHSTYARPPMRIITSLDHLQFPIQHYCSIKDYEVVWLGGKWHTKNLYMLSTGMTFFLSIFNPNFLNPRIWNSLIRKDNYIGWNRNAFGVSELKIPRLGTHILVHANLSLIHICFYWPESLNLFSLTSYRILQAFAFFQLLLSAH